MALPAYSLTRVKEMDEDELDAYFNTFAGYIPDAPKTGPSYAIRVGSTTLMADDTHILRQKLEAFVKEQQ